MGRPMEYLSFFGTMEEPGRLSANGIRPQVQREISAPLALRRLFWRRSFRRFRFSASPGPVLQGQCSAFPLLRVHDRRSDDAPGWLQTPLHAAAYPPDLAELHEGGCKLPAPLAGSRQIWQSCA